MAEIQHNTRLNGFVISIGRSLLQYADECWPWVGTSEADSARRGPDTANARTRLAFTWGCDAMMLQKPSWTRPAIRSVVAAAPPR